TQTRRLMTWDKDLKRVKWLLLDFQTDLPADGERRLFVQYRDAPPNPPPPRPVVAQKTDTQVIVDTGALRMTFWARHPYYQAPAERDFLARCEIKTNDGWRDILHDRQGLFLYMKDQRGNLYDSCTAGPRPIVTVEEAGPMRACVCLKGYHAALNGARFCPYILRFHFFAGRSDVRVLHTFIYDQEAHSVELSAIGMKLRPRIGDFSRAAIGGQGQVHSAATPVNLALLQSSDQEYRVFADGAETAPGAKSAGWASLSGRQGSVAAAIRYHWQEFPKGFCVRPGELDAQVWPESHPEPLRFTTPFSEPAIFFKGTRDEKEFQRLLAERPTAPLNLKSLGVNTLQDFLWVEKMVEKYGQGRAISYNDTGCDSGVGAAKTTEIWLRFSAEAVTDAEAASFNAAVQEPLIAPADPAYTCATQALGHACHAGDPRFRKTDDGLDDILRLVAIEPAEKCRLYGMMRYGNMVCSHAPGPAFSYAYYKDTAPEKALRYVGPYNNESNDQIGAVWGNFVRTGRRDHYFLAQRYSRTIADVCTIHKRPGDPLSEGLMQYHNGHQWTGGGSPSHTLASGLLMDYCFTGEQRLLDVAREYADWVVRTQEPCGIVSCREGVLHREFTGPLWNLLEVYEATWEERYGDVARRSLNWFLRTLPAPGEYPISVYTRGDRGDEAVVEPSGGYTGHARDIYRICHIA
ncbi:MAG TPA: glycoside hydrolase family 127 protein, partial [Candidatus Brocadiia bacterium]|nr:glycoside hydrolase family 127 protein [Candidatus Brocadiia bacterium]